MSANTRAKQKNRMSQEYLNSLIIKVSADVPEVKDEPIVIERQHVDPKPILRSEERYDTLFPEETFKDFCGKVRQMMSKYESNKAELSRLENEMQDLLHFVEMGKNKNANEGFKLYKKLCEVRRQRRVCKNEIDLLQPVYEMFHGTKMLDQIACVQGQCRAMKQTIDNRSYFVRTDVLSEFAD